MAQNNRPAVSGPWIYEPEIKRVLSSIRLPNAERNITICLMGRAFSAEVTESNGRLLAAAPALRDKLQQAGEDCNTLLDNWSSWTPEQIKNHIRGMQSDYADTLNAI